MTPLPSKAQIRQWIAENPTQANGRDIARAFGIKGAARGDLARMIEEVFAEDGQDRTPKAARAGLPPVAVLEVLPPDGNGDLFARPLEAGVPTDGPAILILPQKGDPALGGGMRILARLAKVEAEDHGYEARLIRALGTTAHKVLGIFRKSHEGGRIQPIDKGADKEWRVPRDGTAEARDGELVEAELLPKRANLGLPTARIVARLGDPSGPRAVSLIAIHQHGIPDDFPDAVIAEADGKVEAALGSREDLRDLNLCTIDPPDARDRDDAVYAEPDTDPANPGGHILWVAIADVAHYVTPGSALDREARKRGNSTYFPDRVVPMLPDILSGDLCSLHENVDRACLAVRMVIDAEGHKLRHAFTRGLMRSKAALSYAQVQAAIDGSPDAATAPLLEPVLRPLYAAYASLKQARAARQPLELDLPERKIVLSDEGKITSISYADRFDAHKLIEEFMVLANVAAAEELVRLKSPLLFRVHEEPSPEKIEALREVAQSSGFVLAKGQVLKTAHLNRLLEQAEGSEFDELINITALRSMTQAYYSPQNFGHFGLALKNYAHFTSPIRRYSDLIVHRGLIAVHGWGKDGLSPWDVENIDETAKLISDTERRSMAAERDTTDRYLAAYLSDRVGAEFGGRIAGVQKFGLFVKLDETGADGLVPIRDVGREYFRYDEETQTLTGADTGQVIGLGQRVTVRLAEATPVTGGLVLELLSVEGGLRTPPRGGKKGYAPRKGAGFKAREAGIKKKLTRKRR